MPATAVYDANVLYPNTLRDLLIRLARGGLVRARWTEHILEEMTAALRRNRADIDEGKIQRLRMLMNSAVRDCLVEDYEEITDSLVLPDRHDRHVLAAAIAASAQTIVTWNLRDFPTDALSHHGIQAQTPDDFISDLIQVSRPLVCSCVQQIVDARVQRPQTAHDVLKQLERDGLIRATAELASDFNV